MKIVNKFLSLLCIFSLLFEGFSSGLVIFYYTKYFKFKGLIYSLINLVIFKVIYIMFLIILLIKCVKGIKYWINRKKNQNYYQIFFNQYKRNYIMLILVVITELIIKLFLSKIFLYFSFLIK